MDENQEILFRRIEALVRRRRVVTARKQIQIFLREQPNLPAKIQVCDWYRRLGLFREGYLLIAPEQWRLSEESTASPAGKRLLWSARFLNLLGATAFAVQIVRRLRCEQASELRVAGDIFLSAYEFKEAFDAFEQAWSKETDRSAYAARLGWIGLCDSLSGLGRNAEALDKIRQITAAPEETLLQGIVLQVQGEYLAQLGQFKTAGEKLEAAHRFFPEGGSSTDHALLWKWQGYIKAREGDLEQAQKLFQSAILVLQAPDIRSEAMLGVYWLMFKVGLLPKNEVPFLSGYPGLPGDFLQKPEMPLAPIFTAKRGQEKIAIYPARGEWIFKKQGFFGIPKEVRLLALLRQSGHHGISLTRLKPLLWPEEVGSFASLELRIFQLLRRLGSKFKMRTQVKSGVVYLSPRSRDQVSVEVSHHPLPCLFYEKHPEFEAKEFAAYYGLGKTQASKLLKIETQNGILSPAQVPGTHKVHYRIRH